jgi:hypothetical protein
MFLRFLQCSGCGKAARSMTLGSGPSASTNFAPLADHVPWHIQEQAFGGADPETAEVLDGFARGKKLPDRRLNAGTVLMREYQDERRTVTVVPGGYVWRESTYPS